MQHKRTEALAKPSTETRVINDLKTFRDSPAFQGLFSDIKELKPTIERTECLKAHAILLDLKKLLADEKQYNVANHGKVRTILGTLSSDVSHAIRFVQVQSLHQRVYELMPKYDCFVSEEKEKQQILLTKPQTMIAAKKYGQIAFEIRTTALNRVDPIFLADAAKINVAVAYKVLSSRLCRIIPASGLLAIYYVHRKKEDFKKFVENLQSAIQPEARLCTIEKKDSNAKGLIAKSVSLSAIRVAQAKAYAQFEMKDEQGANEKASSPPPKPPGGLSLS